LSVPLSVIDFGLLNDGFNWLFSMFLICLKAFKKITCHAGLPSYCMRLKIVDIADEGRISGI